MEFKYKAWSEKTGQKAEGTINASSKETACKLLADEQIIVFSICPVETLPKISKVQPHSIKEAAASSPLISNKFIDKILKSIVSCFKLIFNVPLNEIHVSKRTLSIFFQMLSALTKAGIPLVTALGVIKKQFARTERFGLIAGELLTLIQTGYTISSAMSKFPNAFSLYSIAMVSAGEVSGDLPNIFSRLAGSYESQTRMENNIKNALFYPAFVFLLSIGMVAALCKFALPPFIELFKGLAVPMPPLTLLFLKFIAVISRTEFLISIILFLVFAVMYARKQLELPETREKIEGLFLHIPLIKTFFRVLASSKFCQTLGELLTSGVPLLKCLQCAGAVAGSVIMQKNLKNIIANLTQGALLSQEVKKTGLFPPLVSQVINVGETTGNMPFMLLKAADYFHEEVGIAAEKMQQLIEPFILIFLGIVVTLFVLIFFVPIYAALSQLG